MTAPPSIDLSGWLTEQLGQASPDLLRQMITTFVTALMGAEADAVCGAEYGVRSEGRTNTRNGYRHRDWDTRVGSIDLAIPKLRARPYFPDWLLEHRRRAEAARVSVVATSYLLGVSTRRMEKLVSTLGIDRLSKSQVSVIAKELDAQVEAFRTRPLDAGPYTFLAADAGPCFTKLPNARDHLVFRMFRCADLQSAGQLVRVEPLTLAVLGRSGSSHRSGSGTSHGRLASRSPNSAARS